MGVSIWAEHSVVVGFMFSDLIAFLGPALDGQRYEKIH